MAVSKNFENKDSKSEHTEGGKQSGGSPFDVLNLLSSFKQIVEQVGQHGHEKPAAGEPHKTASNDGHQELKRGSLLHGEVHSDDHKRGVLLGRLSHNETPHHDPGHLSGILLRRLHQNSEHQDVPQQQIAQQSHQFEQQPQEHPANNWREANYIFRQNTADVTLAGAKVLASGVIGAELNPNLGADEGKLRDMGLPYTRSVDKDMKPFFEHVIRPIMTRQPEQFHSQMSNHGQDTHHSNLPYGGFQHHVQPNYYRADNSYYHQNQQQHLPYGGFQSHMQYYRRQS